MEENKEQEVVNIDDLIAKVDKVYKPNELFDFLNSIEDDDKQLYDIGELLEDYTNNYNNFMEYLVEHQYEWNDTFVYIDYNLIGKKNEYGEEGESLLKDATRSMLSSHIYDTLSDLYVGEAIDLDELCRQWCNDKIYKIGKDEILKIYDYDGVVEHPQFIRVIETNEGTTLFYSVYNADDKRFETLWDYVERLKK